MPITGTARDSPAPAIIVAIAASANAMCGRPLIEFLPDEVAMDMTPADLQSWRTINGYSQAKLAALLGVRVMTVSRWETGTIRSIPPFLYLALEALSARQNQSRLRAESFDRV